MSRIGDYLRLAAAALLAVPLAAPVLHAGDMRGTAEEAQAMVAEAIAYYDEVGKNAAFAKFTDDPVPRFRDRDLYVFVIDQDGVSVANGTDPSWIGRSSVGLQDANGTDIGMAVLDAASAEGGWADYEWSDPATGDVAPKSSWVVLHDGYIFGVGIYKP